MGNELNDLTIKNNLTVNGSINASVSNYTKEPTGFTENIYTRNYNSTNRTITLSGTIYALWHGRQVTELVSGWESAAHDVTFGTYFLYYNGTNFVWSTTPWTFDMLQIAVVYYYSTFKFALNETHKLMEFEVHQELHETFGTYRQRGGDFSNYVLASTTAANRRPYISACYVKDEELITVNPALNTNSYCWRYLSGTGVTNFSTGNADIISLLANNPYYNQFTGGNWVQTLIPNNNYGAIFVIATPVTDDVDSQLYRYQFVQPQTTSSTLSTIRAITINNLNLGDVALSEFVFIEKIIIRYTSANWTLIESTKLVGTNYNAVGITGIFLSTVTTTSDFSGTGTAGNPLALVNKDGYIDYAHAGSSQSYTAGDLKLLNDGLGPTSQNTYAPANVTILWNSTTNRFDFSQLALGDIVFLRYDLKVTTTSPNQIVKLKMNFAIGNASAYTQVIYENEYKTAELHEITQVFMFYIGRDYVQNNPAELIFSSDAAATILINGFVLTTQRRKA